MPRSFEEVLVPHPDAAFNYARWLTKHDADAEDVVRDALEVTTRPRLKRTTHDQCVRVA